MAADDWVSMSRGRRGWWRFDASDWRGPVYVRFEERDGRPVVTELYIDTRGGVLRSNDVRRLDLTRLEAMAASQWDDEARSLADLPGPDLSRLASHYDTDFGVATHWVAESWRAQLGRTKQAPMGSDPKLMRSRSDDPRLSGPPLHGLTDEFLREVRDAYDAAIRRGLHPAPELARQAGAGVSARTVHGWVAKARDRKIMPPGAQGKVG